MADIYNPNDPRRRQQQAAQGGIISAQEQEAPAVLTGQQVQQAPTRSRFTNLQQFVRANVPQEGQQGIAGAIGQTIQKQKEMQQKSIEAAQSQLRTQTEGELQRLGGIPQISPDSPQRVTAEPMSDFYKDPANAAAFARYKQTGEPIRDGNFDIAAAKQQARNQPLSLFQRIQSALEQGQQLSPEDLQSFEQIRQQKFQRPELQNLQQLQQQTEQVQKLAGMAGTEAGRFGLLQQTFGRPGYTTGQQRLDQLLLQATPGQAQQLLTQAGTLGTEAQQALTGLTGTLTTEQDKIGKLAAQREKEAEELISGEVSELRKTLEGRETTQELQAKGTFDLVQKALRGEGLSIEEQQQLESNLGELGKTEIFAPTEALSPEALGLYQSETSADISAFAKPAERARYTTLKQLAGEEAIGVQPGTGLLGGLELEEAQAFDPLAAIKKAIPESEISRRKSEYESRIQPIQEQIQNIEAPIQTFTKNLEQKPDITQSLQRYAQETKLGSRPVDQVFRDMRAAFEQLGAGSNQARHFWEALRTGSTFNEAMNKSLQQWKTDVGLDPLAQQRQAVQQEFGVGQTLLAKLFQASRERGKR